MASFEFVKTLKKGDLLKVKTGEEGWFVVVFDRIISNRYIGVRYSSTPNSLRQIERERVITKFIDKEYENRLQEPNTPVGGFVQSRTDQFYGGGDQTQSTKRHLSFKTRRDSFKGKVRRSQERVSS